jgi:hypothetical protein
LSLTILVVYDSPTTSITNDPDHNDKYHQRQVSPTMSFQVDIWLRGDNHATTETIAPVGKEPRAWTEGDVAAVLTGMLRAIDKAKNPGAAADRPVALRGFSWIVNPFEDGGVVIALEMTLGAIVAGPFDIAERDLSAMISRVMATGELTSPTVH